MEKLQRLLDEVRLILKKAEVKKKEADRRGESFNIFNVLGVTSDETESTLQLSPMARRLSSKIKSMPATRKNNWCGITTTAQRTVRMGFDCFI